MRYFNVLELKPPTIPCLLLITGINQDIVFNLHYCSIGIPGDSVVKNTPAVLEMWVWKGREGGEDPLGREDPLEKEMATHSSILAWEIPWTEEPDGLQSMGLQELDMTE